MWPINHGIYRVIPPLYREFEKKSEILKKPTRPYLCIEMDDSHVIAIPFKSNVNRKNRNAFLFHGIHRKGARRPDLDITKTVILPSKKYLIERLVSKQEYKAHHS